ncbi:hypothetical protein [Vibrio sagamiensis]|uniref:Uncharacterized protein n=1 Tax=Vibrio sagamiensis NBRC 104589 TaxID=1219064 RepID=A0A511Q9T1_9VIBR|nr:hypothetical protein [Vibrio sagamiensis]GEM74050.1 hypothetical protein VSA01S_01620 [Vibrio sagamiensis NBRC 104589]
MIRRYSGSTLRIVNKVLELGTLALWERVTEQASYVRLLGKSLLFRFVVFLEFNSVTSL